MRLSPEPNQWSEAPILSNEIERYSRIQKSRRNIITVGLDARK